MKSKSVKLGVLIILFLLLHILTSYSQTNTLSQTDSYVEQAKQAINNKEIDKGIALFEKALELNPRDYVVLTALAGLYADFKHDFNKATELFKQALDIKDYDMAHFGLGLNYAAMGNKEEAKKEFDKTILITDKEQVRISAQRALMMLQQKE